MTHAVSRHAALTSLALAIAAPAAFAQATPDTFDPVVVTASRYPQHLSEVLSDTQTISSDDIARSGASSIVDLLQKQRGIEVARNGGAGTAASVFIRGANSNQNIVLVDGVRIGSSTLGTANWSALPLSSIDHIEIVYGPLSTMYGADAIGGVIQIFTKKGDGAARVSAFAGYGSNNTRQVEAQVAGSTGGPNSFSYALAAGKEKSDGFSASKIGASPEYTYNPDKDGYDKESFSGQFGYQMAKGHEVGLVLLNSKLKAQYDAGPGYDARSNQKLENISVFTKNEFLPNWTSELRYAEARDKSGDDSSAGSWGKSQIDTKQSDITWQNDIRIGRDNLQLLASYRDEDVTSSSTPEVTGARHTKSFAAAYNMVRGAHLFNISGRSDDSSAFGTHNTGSVAYGYRITNALRASASYGTSFRAPTFNELYYPGYGLATNKPEQGRNVEVGLGYDDGVSKLSASYYHNKVTDLLVNTSPCPDPLFTGYGCAYNVNKALLEGLTIAGARKFGAFNVSGNIDLQDPRDETKDKQLVRRAKKHANFAVDYTLGALTSGAEWQLSGKRFDDAANKNVLGGYGLVNLYATYQFARDWSVLARWNNIANKDYELARFYATPGSKVFVGVRYGMK
ncbi:TonB-dependent receptor domain-containing protein [Janthinobacterium lividum]|uniref:TonB-dependent receptor domain-containing protein n=1 Tax=Janthinobacterium lividum TaxID=29581 RepID=UPI00044ECCF0|nr:TonB-dependent receptor [Janthinobacterium lividum]EZP40616.1 Vitamin B12 transporter BtuB [Janthinobacterium lividum]